MDYFNLGDTITVKDLNAITYLLRKFKRLNTGLKLGSLTLTSDYGSFVFDKALTSVGGNFIIEQEVNVSSSDCLKNCFYSFVFNVIDVNTRGTVNKRQVKVTGGTGDTGSLFVTLPVDLIESDEVILPNFELDIVFDEHEYYTPVADIIKVTLTVDKPRVRQGETATITAVLTDENDEPLVDVPCNFFVDNVMYTENTDSNGEAVYLYTGIGSDMTVTVRVIDKTVSFYDIGMSVVTAVFTGDNISLGSTYSGAWLVSVGDVVIDWGDGTSDTVNNPTGYFPHRYTDGLNEHTITFFGEVTSLGEYCFFRCTGLTSISIPSSVTSLGEYCFNECTGLIDYQLYWRDTSIIEYNSHNMRVNTGTVFTIPSMQRKQYINKKYPSNNLKTRDYDLYSTVDKEVIEADETSTVTCTLTYNGEALEDETVSYTIKQGATIIDTGSDTTDSNGQIEVEYTGTSIGKINIIFTYDTLTESTTIIDSIFHDTATSTDYNTNWENYNNRLTVSRDTSGTLLTPNSQNNGYWMSTRTPPTDFIIEFNVVSIQGNVYVAYTSNKHIRLDTRVRAGDNVRIEYTDGVNKVYVNNVLKATVNQSADSYIGFQLYTGSSFKYRDYVLYGVSGSSKVDTSISISSDKASYYTDESILLTGTLVDDDSQPLVNASVKVYRGASLVDTVSTDSNGEYEKTVTGLSAGSYSFKAVYDGDDTYQGSTSSTVSVIVQNHTYSLSISSDKQIILTTESVTITGTLLKDSSAYGSQSVVLYDGATIVDTLTTDGSGNYSKTITGLSVGVHTFKAVNSNAESSTISITVNEPTHTYSLSIASDKSSILTTESVTISGQLLMDSSPYASQSVALYDGATLVATLTTDSDGEYEETVSGLSVGTHTFKAVNANAESSILSVTVNKISTTTSITASSSSILTTDTLTLTGSVTNVSTGSVKLYDGSTLVDEVSLSSGSYSKSLTGLSVGTHTYKAVYDGDTTHSGSESSTVTVTVSEPAPVHDYSLSVATTKDILSYADSESATITATLTANGVAVEGETLTYTIKHGATTIDTGSDTTDSSGQISFTYASSGIGDVTVEVDYGILLQETYAIEDCLSVPKLDGTETIHQIAGTTTINGNTHEMSGGTGYLLPAWSNSGNWELTYEFKGSNNNCASTIIKGDETNENNNQILIHTSEIAISTNGSTTRISGLPSSYNTWHSVTVVKNGSDITVTMDNVTKTFTWSLATTLSSLAIGVQIWGGVPTIRKIKVKAL